MAVACGEPGASVATTTVAGTHGNEQLGALAAAQELWVEAAPADYTLTQLDRSSDSEPSTVAVHDGEVVSLSSEAATVDDVFGTIEDSIHDGATVDVAYHPQLGYPTRVVIDRDGDGQPDISLEYGDLELMPTVKNLHELREARRRWEAQSLDSYRYIFRFDCTCPDSGTFEVDIRGGRIADARPLDEAARQSQLHPGFDIDAAFDDLEEWFTDSSQIIEEGILAVDVRTDPRYGYPRWFRIEAEDVDGEFFEGKFTMVVTIDLVAELEPAPEPGPDADDLAALDSAVARWQQAGLSDYRYAIELHCQCPAEIAGPFVVTVSGGVTTSVTFRDGTDAAGFEVPSIEDTFEQISRAIADGTDVDVIYDLIYGFAEFAVIDPEAVAVDAGLAFSITEFEVLGQ